MTARVAAKSTRRGEGGGAEPLEVVLRGDNGATLKIPGGVALQQAAMKWSYVLRNRRRWIDQPRARLEQAREARRELEAIAGAGALSALSGLARAALIEITIPFSTEERGWEARIFPWEYMLSAATGELRGGRPLLVVRHLRRDGSPRRRVDGALFVESAPGVIRELFNFDAERVLIEASLELEPAGHLADPTRSQLRQKIVDDQPAIIHLTGLDTHQGATLGLLPESRDLDDGYLLRSESELPDAINAEQLAAVLTAAQRPPVLVAFNIQNSAARLAPMAVAAGAQSALGFQDYFDDSLSEIFFTNFYHDWQQLKWDAREAFQSSCRTLFDSEHQSQLRGTGIVLWSDRSLLPDPAAARRGPTAPPRAAAKRPASAAKRATTGDRLRVDVEPFTEINYSLLHNNRDLFRQFRISSPERQAVSGIQVAVTLHVGAESFPYRATVDVSEREPVREMRERIRIPLTYSLARAIPENVRTSLYVSVTCEGREYYCETFHVTLLPVDEWRDTDDDRIWLPSFVLPRDPAIGRIIDAAQRYLAVLADDCAQGFDGYQSVVTAAGGRLETAGVDRQVQAIWAALAGDFALSYINPPPSYSVQAQRLRTPSEVINGRRGTCIDLALLLAACCEYVDIYPVIFLLEGHAFPGYWRSDAGHTEFQQIANPPTPGAGSSHGGSSGQQHEWHLRKDFYREVVQQVHAGSLVPLESTLITARGGFFEAIEEGMFNLRSKRDFHSLLDIRLARSSRNPVTPIPLGERSS
jgi:hypothetical protein